jgi:hypothetical protein
MLLVEGWPKPIRPRARVVVHGEDSQTKFIEREGLNERARLKGV